MENFKGTPGEWKKDVGIDELQDNLYQCIVYSPSVNTHNVAHFFGATVEEAEANAKLGSKAKELLEVVQELVDVLSDSDYNVDSFTIQPAKRIINDCLN